MHSKGEISFFDYCIWLTENQLTVDLFVSLGLGCSALIYLYFSMPEPRFKDPNCVI